MAWSAESISTTAKEHSQVAASHAFPVNKFISVLLAKVFAVAKPIHSTFLAHEVLFVEFIKPFGTVLHATEVRLLALGALVECELM